MKPDGTTAAAENQRIIRDAEVHLRESLGKALTDRRASEVQVRIPINNGRLGKPRSSIERV